MHIERDFLDKIGRLLSVLFIILDYNNKKIDMHL